MRQTSEWNNRSGRLHSLDDRARAVFACCFHCSMLPSLQKGGESSRLKWKVRLAVASVEGHW